MLVLEGPLRIAIDIGGTFTDLQVLEESSGRSLALKSPTTPHDPSIGFMNAITLARDRFGFDLSQVETIFHGTTIATNAVLEHKLPRAALVATAGFRDVLEIGRHARQDVYASHASTPRLLIPRFARLEVQERMSARGTISKPLTSAALEDLVCSLRALELDAVAVCLLHAYANPEHERAVEAAINEAFQGRLPVCLSHQVSPEIREYERTSTTALNALLMPVIGAYIEALGQRIAEAGFNPRLYLVQSNGGVVTPEAARRYPARLLLSGPSGGAIAAEQLSAALAEPNLVGVDLGGTSFDVSVLTDGKARVINQGTVDSCPVRLPMVEIRTIGAGGGSIARVDDAGRLHVGPDSAGADPGPAAYGRGGTQATLTDANVVLGRIDPAFFLGGDMALEDTDATAVITNDVAKPLNLSTERAAEGIVQVAVSLMAGAIRLSLFEKGLDPKDFAVVSFGGAGGLHAAEVATAMDIPRVIYPRAAGTLSAWGMLFCDVVHAFARTRLTPANDDAPAVLADVVSALAHEGDKALADEDIDPAARSLKLTLDMRYPGQAYEIAVPLEGTTLTSANVAQCCTAFHALHYASFAHSDENETPEIVTVRLNAIGLLTRPNPHLRVPGEPAESKGTREIWLDDAQLEVPVFDRDAFGPDDAASGPLLIEDVHSTIFLPRHWWVEGTERGDLIAQELRVNPMARE
ncbi:MAG: N-methylhydantoinase A [Gammaproteobacteria bacterium]